MMQLKLGSTSRLTCRDWRQRIPTPEKTPHSFQTWTETVARRYKPQGRILPLHPHMTHLSPRVSTDQGGFIETDTESARIDRDSMCQHVTHKDMSHTLIHTQTHL